MIMGIFRDGEIRTAKGTLFIPISKQVEIVAQEDHPVFGRRYKIADSSLWFEDSCFNKVMEIGLDVNYNTGVGIDKELTFLKIKQIITSMNNLTDDEFMDKYRTDVKFNTGVMTLIRLVNVSVPTYRRRYIMKVMIDGRFMTRQLNQYC